MDSPTLPCSCGFGVGLRSIDVALTVMGWTFKIFDFDMTATVFVTVIVIYLKLSRNVVAFPDEFLKSFFVGIASNRHCPAVTLCSAPVLNKRSELGIPAVGRMSV